MLTVNFAFEIFSFVASPVKSFGLSCRSYYSCLNMQSIRQTALKRPVTITCVQKRRVTKPSHSDDSSSLSAESRQAVSVALSNIRKPIYTSRVIFNAIIGLWVLVTFV